MATSGGTSNTFEERHSVARAESLFSRSLVLACNVNLCRAIFLVCLQTEDTTTAVVLFGSLCTPNVLQLKHKLQADFFERSDHFAGEAEDSEKLLVHEPVQCKISRFWVGLLVICCEQ